VRAIMDTQFHLRPAGVDDCRLIWELANEPSVRSLSFNTDPIPWDTHVKWFIRKLADVHCVFYIACSDKGIPFGQVRFDVNDGMATVSLSLDAEVRGQRYGSVVIESATRMMFAETSIITVNAYIRPENIASAKAFESAGYEHQDACQLGGQKAIHMNAHREWFI
jgi:UDP-2,4-diacetamido-2,4,6-trideoxy-beta-L-altropyranose hydrolase